MEILLRRIFTIGARRGLSGNRAWATIALLAGAARMVHRMHARHGEVLWRQELRGGDVFRVVAEPGPGSKQARRAARAAKRG